MQQSTSRAWYQYGRVQQTPQVPRRYSTIRRPFGTDLLYPLWCWKLTQTVRPLNSLLYSEVQVGQYIWSAEPEHHEHLGRPPADAFDLGERRNDLLIGQLVKSLDRQLPGCDPGAQILEIRRFLAREAHGAQLLVRCSCQLRRKWRTAAKQTLKASVDRSRRLTRQLLKNDRTGNSIEVSAVARRPAFVNADLVDYLSERGVDFLEVRDGFSAQRTGTSRLHFGVSDDDSRLSVSSIGAVVKGSYTVDQHDRIAGPFAQV